MNSDLTAVLAAMSVRELRKELRERGVNTASCIEKADLVQLLITNWDVEAKPPPPPEDSPGTGATRVQQQGPPHTNTFTCQACGRGDGRHGNGLLKCGKCNGAHYCSKECQVAHWPAHRLECKEIQLGRQCFADSVGMEVSTAYKAWFKRFKLLIAEAAAALLWPAPHFSPRNRSHGLLLHVTYNSSKPPRFQVGAVEELTMEAMSAMMVSADGGDGFQWPPLAPSPDPSLETMKVIISLGLGKVCRGVRLSLTGQMVSELKDGTVKLSVSEIIARINMLS